MKYDEIKALLDRYWEGETSIEEERSIKTYFNAGPIDERLLPVAPLFKAINEEQTVQMKARARQFALRPRMYQYAAAAAVALLLAAGWWISRPEVPQDPMVKALPVPGVPQEIKTVSPVQPEKPAFAEVKTHKIPLFRKKSRNTTPVVDKETAKAMAEIKAALALVSSKIEKGKRQAVKGAELLDAVEKVPHRDQG